MWSSSSSSYFKRCHIQIPLSTFPINAINQRSRSFHIITANKLLHPNISSSVNFNSKLPPKLFHQSTIKKSSIHVPSYCRPLSSNSPTTSTVKTQLPPPSDAQRKTIYALATPPGKAGVAVIRFSGPEAYAVFERVTRPYTSISSNSLNKIGEANISSSTKLEYQSDVNHARVQGERSSRKRKPLEHRKMTRCIVVNPLTGEDIDDGLAVFFKGPSSFTTEDVLELHVHSGRAILSSILSALSTLSIPLVPSNGSTRTEAPLLIRPAERGEFTRRAFEGGRLDLTQAEALGDLINAETDVQRRVALLGSRGKTREVFEHIREEIIQAMALTEALIDFGEGEDVEEGVFDEARGIVEGVRDRIRRYLSDGRRGEILRNGVRLAIFGPPNAGKSSLLNYLAGREAAIVTDVPGTTRDILEVRLDLDGLAVVLADTAGLRTTEDVVEKIGVEKAVERIAESDISLCVLSLAGGEGERVEEEVTRLIGPDTYVLLNKVDACGEEDVDALRKELPGCAGTWIISVSTGQGLDKFVSDIGGVLKARFGLEGEKDVVVTNERHRGELERAEVHLAAFAETEDVVVAAEELRYTSRAIGRVTGAVDVEDVLDSLFSTFCIGK